jgi:methylenetetrahydrofolate dehydrogenase (NADP+) / methenyltetrahydrofolate cyclohydrolase / formyltetrahydrofolate synthetase
MKRRTPHYISCTPLGILKLIHSVCPNIEGKRVTVCGRSNIVGMPLALMLNKYNATVSLCHSKTAGIQEYIREADIVVTAVGNPGFFKGEWFKQGSIAIDVGINEVKDLVSDKRRIVGDIDFDGAIERCSYITPVPGGVGPMTIAMLMSNIVDAWEKQCLKL